MHFFEKHQNNLLKFFLTKGPKRGVGKGFMRKFQYFYFFHAVKVLEKVYL
jgi:hypothetical protein